MAQRLSFPIAQPITIIGWYISSFLLVADISSIIHIVKVPDERRALTQAFYYAIYAAALYFIIATLMVITVYGAWRGHYPKEFKLTMSQRTLMLQTISFMIYMVGGAGVYAKIEGWQFLDALYFTNYTLLTVGLGDYSPNTHLGRGLLFPYAIGGIVILGLVIGSIRSLVLERGKKKLGSRQVEKMREKMLKKIHKKDETEKITPIENKSQAKDVGMTEKERRREEFNLMRQIQDQASTRQKWTSLIISGGAWLFLWFFGALIFYFCEHEQQWSYFGSLYFAYTTLLTIGFGDYKPFSNSGKPFFVFWSLLAVPTLTILISNMGDTVVKSIRDLTLYLGEITVLPGEQGTAHARIKKMAAKATGGKLTKDDEMDAPPGLAGLGHDEEANKAQNEDQTAAMARGADQLVGEVQGVELRKAQSAERRGDVLAESIHEYHYMVAKEFRKVMSHLNESPPRRYSYEEWAWFLKLMGENEDSHVSHRTPLVQVKSKVGEAPDIQDGQTDDQTPDGKDGKDGKGGKKPWSWLGNRSPLMGEMEEAEWVLLRLSVTLEKALKRESDRLAAEKGGGMGAKGGFMEREGIKKGESSSSGGSGRTLEGGRGSEGVVKK